MLVPASLDEPFEGITGDDWVNGSFGGIEVFSEKLHRLEIVSIKGKRIDWISDSDENEVVFLLGSRFRVINKLGRGFFELRELG